MERLPVSWDTFVQRKRIDVVDWLKVNGIENYESLVKELKKRGIEAPPRSAVEIFFPAKKMTKKAVLEPQEDLTKTNQDVTKQPESLLVTDFISDGNEISKPRKGRPRKVHNSQDE